MVREALVIKQFKILMSSDDRIVGMVDGAGFEPATSAMPTPRSFQLIYPP